METDYLEQELARLTAEKQSVADYVTEEKPYWVNLRHPRDDDMQWELNNYAPLAHYDRAIREIAAELDQT